VNPGPEAQRDAGLAARLAEAAGALLLDVRQAGRADEESAADLGRRGDQASNSFLLGQLAAERPGDAVLSEEAEDDRIRLQASRVWIIDPLDGTREFALPGRPDWAVHVALWEAGGAGITAAAVALPASGELFTSDPPPPVRSAGRRTRPLILVSDSRPPAFAAGVADQVGADVASLGSAGAKTMAVVRGDADGYLHAGGQWEWDSAAPVGVAQAAGLHASRLDGSPLRYNQPHPYLPDLLVATPDMAGPLLAALAPYR
jgi:3'(2'), 5'-bisphosphate nucleotidase